MYSRVAIIIAFGVLATSDSTGLDGTSFAGGRTLKATVQTFPGYKGDIKVSGSVSVSMAEGSKKIKLDASGLQGLPAKATGGLHIHSGTSCEAAGKHYFKHGGTDVWTTVKWHSDTDGKSTGQPTVVENGYGYGGIKDHALVIHGTDGTIIGCGLLQEDVAAAAGGASVNTSAAFAEYVAMTLFVVLGCGSAMSVAKESGWVLQVALTFGLAISSLAYAVGHYSGGQINCAVTFGLVLAGKVSVAQGLANFVAQMLGSITGALILRNMFPEEKDKTGGLATNKVGEGWTQTNALIGEFAMTFLLMFVVLETATNPASKANREMAALAIGFAVFLAHSVLIAIDGCSINPTRTFGPALVRKLHYKNGADAFDDMWVFWAGPLLGAAAAATVSAQMMR